MKRLMWMVLLTLMVVGFAQDEMMMSHADVRYVHIAGSGMYEGVAGTATIITWDTGEHEVLVRLEGLGANSGAFANHIHFNATGDATCEAQNGDQVVALSNLEPDQNGVALAYTKLDATVIYPEGTTYINIHNNSPEPVGMSISCGDVHLAGEM
jgi:superoxide dismutase, Cu-Zn family